MNRYGLKNPSLEGVTHPSGVPPLVRVNDRDWVIPRRSHCIIIAPPHVFDYHGLTAGLQLPFTLYAGWEVIDIDGIWHIVRIISHVLEKLYDKGLFVLRNETRPVEGLVKLFQFNLSSDFVIGRKNDLPKIQRLLDALLHREEDSAPPCESLDPRRFA